MKLSNGYKGQGADKSDYIKREGKYKSPKLAQEMVAHEDFNLPSWAKTSKDFFEAADKFERANGVTFKHYIVMLPCELSSEENIKIAEEIKEKIAGSVKAGGWAIHDKQAVTANVQNVHMHLICSERIQDSSLPEKPPQLYFRRYNSKNPANGGYKKDLSNTTGKGKKNPEISKIREAIADAINSGYERNNMSIRVSGESLKAQKEKAIKENDKDRAEFFDRKPVTTISTSQWKKIQKILEEDNIIDHTQPIPIVPNETNWPTFQKLIETDFKAAEVLLERTNLQKKKLKYMLAVTRKATLEITENEYDFITGRELLTATESVALSIQSRTANNSAYINLYNQIYSNKLTQTTLINNLITKGLTKKYQKAKQKYEQYNSKKNRLSSFNRLDESSKKRLDLLIKISLDEMSQAQEKIQQIRTTPEAKIRYEKAIAKLKKTAASRRQNALNKNADNKILKEINQELSGIIKDIKLYNPEKIPKEILLKLKESENLKEQNLQKVIADIRAELKPYLIKKDVPSTPPQNVQKPSRVHEKDGYQK